MNEWAELSEDFALEAYLRRHDPRTAHVCIDSVGDVGGQFHIGTMTIQEVRDTIDILETAMAETVGKYRLPTTGDWELSIEYHGMQQLVWELINDDETLFVCEITTNQTREIRNQFTTVLKEMEMYE